MSVAAQAGPLHFALIGTPNSGKTALFNALTGSRQKVANYPGVTVERKSGMLRTPGGRSVNLIDLPGTYSLRARSPDEEVTRDVVLGRFGAEAAPDLLVCVADSTNLRLALRLVLELKRIGRPLLLVLNMIDIARRRGIDIDIAQLMARAAFLMDRIMGGAGLHGRAFIPLLSSFACAIPGIMATRVIDNPRDRLTTILVAPLMTCSARIPVYTLIISAFIPDRRIWGFASLQGVVMFGLYAAGILSALGVSALAKFMFWHESPTPPFMLELPDYKLPRPRSVLIGVYTRAWMFLHRAGTTIFSMMVLIWFIASFPRPTAGATAPAIDYSLASWIGHALQPVTAAIGFNWQINVALIPGMAAREVAVAVLGTVYAIEGGKENATQIGQALAQHWSLATALAVLAWYIFAPQCASTLAVIKRETGSWHWMAVTFAYMLALAYVAAFITFHAAVALGGG